MSQTIINGGILALAALFLLIGLFIFFVRGVLGQSDVDKMYGVGRLQSRQVRFWGLLQGFVLSVIGLALLVTWNAFRLDGEQANAVEPTQPVATVAPPTQPPATNTPVPVPTAIPPTEPADEPEPTIESEPPTAEPEPESVEPTAEPTSAPSDELPQRGRAVVVSVGGVNMRDDPDGELVVLIENGAELYIIDEPVRAAGGFDWVLVESADGTLGWVAEPFIQYITVP